MNKKIWDLYAPIYEKAMRMDKKYYAGKIYYVYMITESNKFFRIYYGKVKEYVSSLTVSE